MKYGPIVFLSAFFALAASWFGLVMMPQVQLGVGGQETTLVNTAELYPLGRPGLARQGLEVYRANGCNYCHSQQVGQTGMTADVVLIEVGTNAPAVADALNHSKAGITDATAAGLAGGLPKTVARGVSIDAADAISKALKSAGAKAQVTLIPVGPEITRGWGLRRSVAADYLFDSTVMLGSQRVGPDLANVGLRSPDANALLAHLYAPHSTVKDSAMPAYRFLFQKKKIDRQPSSDALQLSADFAPAAGYEIVPTPEAKALVAYLQSLRAETPLFEAPFTPASAPVNTNAPAK